MQDFGTNLICVDDNIDSSKDSGKLMIAVLSAVAEIERENILIQSMAGRRQKAREGRWNGGQAPYGYTIDKEKGILVVNPDEAEIVKLIYDRFIFDHMGYNKVAKWLNDNGYNPVYAGKIAYGRRAHEKIQGARNEYRIVKQDEYETYEGQHEAIIDPENGMPCMNAVWRRGKDARRRVDSLVAQ